MPLPPPLGDDMPITLDLAVGDDTDCDGQGSPELTLDLVPGYPYSSGGSRMGLKRYGECLCSSIATYFFTKQFQNLGP